MTTSGPDCASGENCDMSPPQHRLSGFTEGREKTLGSNRRASAFSSCSYNNLATKCEKDRISWLKKSRSADAMGHFMPFSLNTLHRTESSSDVVCLDSGIDVVEYDSDYRIYMDIPSGVASSIRILQQEDGIRIEGERRVHYDGCKCVLFQHRQKGKFIVFLPCNKELVDIEHSKASVNNGELCISIAKRRLPDEGCGSFSEGEVKIRKICGKRL